MKTHLSQWLAVCAWLIVVAVGAAMFLITPAHAQSIVQAFTFQTRGRVTVTTTATQVIATGARNGGQIQNQSTSVMFCSDNNTVNTTTTYAFTLKACTTTADGTGGIATLTPGYFGDIWCIVAAGTGAASESEY